MEIPVIAASTQRQIGFVIAGIVLLAMAVYWLFNWLEGRNETGAEIELAANRNINMSDEEMETKRLDLALTGGLALLTIIAVAYPLYWLGEPGRQTGLVEFTDSQAVVQGAALYEANCAQCHGSANGDGGVAANFALVDTNGVFVEQVQWTAPSLAAVLDRFSYDEVKHVLNFGRTNSPMPAWGAVGGGPMTDQQIDRVIQYLASEQQTSTEIKQGVLSGLDDAALFKARQDNADLWAAQLAHEDWIHDLEEDPDLFEVWLEADDEFAAAAAGFDNVEDALLGLSEAKDGVEAQLDTIAEEILLASETDQIIEGELLFNNPAAGGAYGCARCHSAGFSYNANDFPENPLLPPIVNGGGGFGPSLLGVLDQFETAEQQTGFIGTGSREGARYGNFGQGDGGGQMPGFLACWAEDNVELARIETDRITGHCDGTSVTAQNANDGEILPRDGILTEAQIQAIVAYERSLEQ